MSSTKNLSFAHLSLITARTLPCFVKKRNSLYDSIMYLTYLSVQSQQSWSGYCVVWLFIVIAHG